MGVPSRLNAVREWGNSVFGYLNTCIYREGRLEWEEYYNRKRSSNHLFQPGEKDIWYFVGGTVTLFLSVLRKNYEVVLFSLTLSVTFFDVGFLYLYSTE